MQTSLQLGSKLLKGLGVMSDDVSFLSQLVRDSMEQQAQSADRTAAKETDLMKSMQVSLLKYIILQLVLSSLLAGTLDLVTYILLSLQILIF